MGVEQKLSNMGIVTTTLEQMVNWGRTRAMWPMLFGLACCAIEMVSVWNGNKSRQPTSIRPDDCSWAGFQKNGTHLAPFVRPDA